MSDAGPRTGGRVRGFSVQEGHPSAIAATVAELCQRLERHRPVTVADTVTEAMTRSQVAVWLSAATAIWEHRLASVRAELTAVSQALATADRAYTDTEHGIAGELGAAPQ